MNYKKIKNIIQAILLSALFFSCNEGPEMAPEPVQNKTVKIAVFSDPHYFSSGLWSEGAAFDLAVSGDRKMMAESPAIADAVISLISSEKPDIVIISGDMSKDGELQSHTEFSQKLKILRQGGAKVYVVPGNHDIDNGNSYRYYGSLAAPVDNTSVSKFVELYEGFGFGEAVAKDPNSLTYIAEPTEGLWIFAIDACRYSEKSGYNATSGALSEETLNWIIDKLKEAKSKKIMAIGVMHHGLVEHFTGQKVNPISSAYVIDDWENVSSLFAANGMKMICTGHFHANDITVKESGGNFIFDIETGSAVTAPCPYRIIELTLNEKAIITTKYIKSINYDTKGQPFPDYAKQFLRERMTEILNYELTNSGGMDSANAAKYCPAAVSAMEAHLAGDEKLDDIGIIAIIEELLNSGDFRKALLGSTIQTMFTDLEPADNNITIDLKTGKAF